MRLIASLFALSFLMIAAPAYAKDLSPAETYVDGVAKDALNTISKAQEKKITEEQAKTSFRKILNSSFDVPLIAKRTLGRYWRVATPAEQKEYSSLLQSVILNKYADKLLNFSGGGYTIDSSRPLGEKGALVSMTLKPVGEAPVVFGWYLEKSGNSFKVVDLSVEGISMVATHRDDFGAVIERNGGKVQALIDALKRKQVK
jgi:phospholipid transport system substrate-binding protein